MKLSAVAVAVALAAAPTPPPANTGTGTGPPLLAGFTPARSAWQRDYEKRLLALPQPEECGAILRELTRKPHLAGTEGNARVADFLAAEYKKAGFQVEMPAYDVLLSYPRSAKLEIVGEPDVRLGRGEEPIASDPDTAIPEAAVPWNAYAPSAEVTAEVVYVNRGSAEDYDRLAKMGIDVRGKIALARYFGGYRGGKSLEAEKRGVLAVLVYSDPADDGWGQGAVYPDGPWGPASHFQRGANVYDFIVPGDPLTPGWPSRPGMERIPISESQILPKMPMMPLSARDGAEILKRLQGPPVPDTSWQGRATAESFRVGPGPLRLHLKIENTREKRTIRNVIATLRGTDEPGRQIILSNHYDAWVYGATDPSSGTAATLALGRALGRLAAEGWKPRRTIVIAAWDAEEYTLTGSTEWGEENQFDLWQNAVVCINVDEATHGKQFSPSASPLLFEAIRDAARDLPDPGSPDRSLADVWRTGAGFIGVQSYATAAGGRDELPVAILGSGSDYTVFFNHLGVPSTDLVFDGPYGVYHSVYDTYQWMATQGDPGFRYHAGMARYAGLLALRFANADVLPLDGSAYGKEIARYAEGLAQLPSAPALASELGDLGRRAKAWSAAAEAAQKAIRTRLQGGRLGAADLAAANEWLLSLEHAVCDRDGIPDRPWFRHLIYAPLPSYQAETLPAIREAMLAGRAEEARRQIERLGRKLDGAATAARRLIGAPPPPSRSPSPRRKP
ncbi:MAG: M28 family metallopeptidase [Acidobacteriota bacterium]